MVKIGLTEKADFEKRHKENKDINYSDILRNKLLGSNNRKYNGIFISYVTGILREQ